MTSYTVTATNSGGNGINLQVKVITSALETGGAAANAADTSTGSVSITPAFSSSYIVFATQNGQSATAFTPDANCTLYVTGGIADTTDGYYSGPGFYNTTTTAGSGVAVGCSAPAEGTNAQVAAYEIQPNPAYAVDGSSPANAQGTGTNTVTSASFTPPASSVLTAIVAANFSGTGGSGNFTISSTPVLTWTLRSSIGASGHNGYAGVYTATVPAPAQTVPAAQSWSQRVAVVPFIADVIM